jgi:hypothetical protein
MKKVIFLNNWGESNSDLLKRYSKQTPGNSGKWGDIEGTSNFDEADYYIVLDGHPKMLSQDKTIFVKREPDYISSRRQNYKHMIDWKDTNCGVTWWINKTYDELVVMEYPEKPKDVSCVASSKHVHRNNYIKSLFKGDSPIDLYGYGHNHSYYGNNYKGPLNYDGKCKLRGMLDYKYNIAMENSQQKNYWGEKLGDAFLSWCVPIYWGCTNMEDYFPEGSYHMIDMNKTKLSDIIEIVKQPVNVEALTKARNIVLNDYNIWEVVNRKIKSINE